MISISGIAFLLLILACSCLRLPENRWRFGSSRIPIEETDEPFEMTHLELLQFKEAAVEELKLNTFRITQESGSFSLDVRQLAVGSTLAIELNVQSSMDLIWLILNSSRTTKTGFIHAHRLPNVTQYTLLLKKQPNDTELLLIAQGRAVKSFAVFELDREAHYKANLVMIWLCGLFLFLAAIGLASNTECWETNPEREVTLPKQQVTEKYRIFQLVSTVAGCDCSICMGCFTKGQLLSITNCYHVFHLDCFEPWYFSHAKCPYCRQSLISYSWDRQLPPKDIRDYETTLSQRNHVRFVLREPSDAEPEELPLFENTTE